MKNKAIEISQGVVLEKISKLRRINRTLTTGRDSVPVVFSGFTGTSLRLLTSINHLFLISSVSGLEKEMIVHDYNCKNTPGSLFSLILVASIARVSVQSFWSLLRF